MMTTTCHKSTHTHTRAATTTTMVMMMMGRAVVAAARTSMSAARAPGRVAASATVARRAMATFERPPENAGRTMTMKFVWALGALLVINTTIGIAYFATHTDVEPNKEVLSPRVRRSREEIEAEIAATGDYRRYKR
ncbi:hypothetical protein PTSG_08792 [Salpingoeca rosetta]|uniref:Uncharacterized protein n=1 Tax=Salpingoeca rosetta (strain ATCC 50818 / BSB-021) TaxID=946362 RepID=F2UKQ1_SALR5|nr:uncharacterized protein PTSG_08792 [Salpingoeca rosetta]EGD77700.1 hypothetical protein PTSG_08792 [Salpingoeca rosetta]|eukprot:XP_004990176.1 hypothetical protein PTSG_08792 [Salpingoeca rosetta]